MLFMAKMMVTLTMEISAINLIGFINMQITSNNAGIGWICINTLKKKKKLIGQHNKFVESAKPNAY